MQVRESGNRKREASLQVLEQTLHHKRPYMIVAPPRSASTALARCLMNHSRMGTYIHEPCDLFAHEGARIGSITERLESGDSSGHILIKEMTFQLGDGEVARSFLRNGKQPLVFLIRHPRLTIESRVRMVLLDLADRATTTGSQRARIKRAIRIKDYRGLSDILTERVFPLHYTGWKALARQVGYCRQARIDYVVLSAVAFRSRPRRCLRKLSSLWKLEYEGAMVEWTDSDLPLGALSEQNSWYSRVQNSTSVLPETADLETVRLPARFQEHLPVASEIYRQMLDDPNAL